jgi:hypothetical protein
VGKQKANSRLVVAPMSRNAREAERRKRREAEYEAERRERAIERFAKARAGSMIKFQIARASLRLNQWAWRFWQFTDRLNQDCTDWWLRS